MILFSVAPEVLPSGRTLKIELKIMNDLSILLPASLPAKEKFCSPRFGAPTIHHFFAGTGIFKREALQKEEDDGEGNNNHQVVDVTPHIKTGGCFNTVRDHIKTPSRFL